MTAITRARAGAGIRFFYSVNGLIPELVADFVRSKYKSDGDATTFSGLLTHARTAGTATYVDNTGTLQTVTDGSPRLDHHVYEGGQWINKGLLFESEARTNLFLHSDMDSGWAKNAVDDDGTTFTKDYSVGPDGAQKMWRFNPNFVPDPGGATRRFRFFESINTTAGDVISFSVFIEPIVATSSLDGVRDVYVSLDADQSPKAYYNCNTLEWEVVPAGVEVWEEDWGNGLRRIGITYTANADDSNNNHFVYFSNRTHQSNFDPYPDGNEDIRFGYAQVELGPTPSSYIPTSGSTVTRAAETLTIPAANLPYSSIAMSIAMRGTMTYADEGAIELVRFFTWRLSGTDRIFVRLDGVNGTGDVTFSQEENNVQDFIVQNSAYSPGINVPFSIASRHGATFLNGAVDGTALTADTTPTALPDLSATDLDLAPDFMGTIESFRMWGQDIGDAGIEGASS